MLLVWATILSGCGRVDQAARGYNAGEWRVGDEPTFVIGGSAASDDAGAIFSVRGAAILSTGLIAVADGGFGKSRLAVFASSGRLAMTIGRPGDGPGEFRSISSVEAGRGDSVFVFDSQQQRLTVFTGDGRLVRTVNARIHTGSRQAHRQLGVRRLGDAKWAVREVAAVLPGEAGRIRRDTVAVGVVDADFLDFKQLELLPGRMTATMDGGSFGPPLFTPQVLMAGWGHCVFTSSGDGPDITVHSSAGRQVSTLMGPGVARPVVEEHLDTLLQYRLDRASPAAAARIRQWVAQTPRTKVLPYYHQMVVDEWGLIWLQVFEPPVGRGRLWYVVSQEGQELAEVRMPRDIDVYAIGKSGVLGRTFGSLGEEKVELLPFTSIPADLPTPLPECAPAE